MRRLWHVRWAVGKDVNRSLYASPNRVKFVVYSGGQISIRAMPHGRRSGGEAEGMMR